ncbi:MAG: ATP-binding protein, partial [Bacteriovoracaceae bacterium]
MAIKKVERRGKAEDAIIESKDQRWHCRNRVTLVFGSNHPEELDTYIYTKDGLEFKTVKFHQAKSKAVEEILDNCIDEFYRGHVTEIHTWLSDDKKSVIIEDNGIGFPIKKIPAVYTEFRTGSKFKDEETDSKGFLHRTLGQNGLGAAATCLTSDSFKVTVKHYNAKQEQTITFIDGALKAKKGKAKKFKGHSGVRVELSLANEVYKNNKIDEELLRKRIIDLAYNNPGLTFYLNDEKYIYNKGLYELAERLGKEKAQNFGTWSDTYEMVSPRSKKKLKGKIDITLNLVIDPESEDRERFISFANSTPTFDGGFHHDRIKRLFINLIKDKLERQAKKEKMSIVDNDILTGMTFVIGITMPNPRFESQTKRKLVRDGNLEKTIEAFMKKFFDKWWRKNKPYGELIIERAKSRHKYQMLKDASKKARKQKKKRIEKLLDANERKNRDKCTLFICEGDSAIGGLRSARNKLYQGGIALKGKPMNVS